MRIREQGKWGAVFIPDIDTGCGSADQWATIGPGHTDRLTDLEGHSYLSLMRGGPVPVNKPHEMGTYKEGPPDLPANSALRRTPPRRGAVPHNPLAKDGPMENVREFINGFKEGRADAYKERMKLDEGTLRVMARRHEFLSDDTEEFVSLAKLGYGTYAHELASSLTWEILTPAQRDAWLFTTAQIVAAWTVQHVSRSDVVVSLVGPHNIGELAAFFDTLVERADKNEETKNGQADAPSPE